MIEEYYKIAGFVQAYDTYFVSIKTWSVTASVGVVAIGVSKELTPPLAIFLAAAAAVMALCFWMTEAQFKLIQQAHLVRWFRLEEGLRRDEYVGPPGILGSFSRTVSDYRCAKTFVAMMLWPHVMLPHAIFLALGLLCMMTALLRWAAAS
jgi:hypothetical protein